jgi:hypothetical protein
MKRFDLRSRGRFVCRALPVLVAALSLVGAKAAQAVDAYPTYPGSGTDATGVIQAALNDTAVDRVILDYHSGGWTTEPLYMNVAGQELWIKGSGSNVGRLVAKWGSFRDAGDSKLIRVMQDGCIINGYANGVDATNGRAYLDMRKTDYVSNLNGWYPASEARHAIEASKNNVTIKGVNIRNTGGDGIYIYSGTGTLVKDVIVDNAYRNAITVISATDLTIDDCTLKNTNGTAPQAGIDFEPNSGSPHVFDNIVISDVIFQNNASKNVQIGIGHLTGTGLTPLDIRFYRCTMDGSVNGIYMAYCYSNGPTGMVYFQDTVITDASGTGINISEWNADRARIVFNDMHMSHCADASASAPITLTDGSPGGGANTIGDVEFQGECYLDDYNTAHTELLKGQSHTSASTFKDITGNIYYRKAYSGSNLVTWTGGTRINYGLTFTPY